MARARTRRAETERRARRPGRRRGARVAAQAEGGGRDAGAEEEGRGEGRWGNEEAGRRPPHPTPHRTRSFFARSFPPAAALARFAGPPARPPLPIRRAVGMWVHETGQTCGREARRAQRRGGGCGEGDRRGGDPGGSWGIAPRPARGWRCGRAAVETSAWRLSERKNRATFPPAPTRAGKGGRGRRGRDGSNKGGDGEGGRGGDGEKEGGAAGRVAGEGAARVRSSRRRPEKKPEKKVLGRGKEERRQRGARGVGERGGGAANGWEM